MLGDFEIISFSSFDDGELLAVSVVVIIACIFCSDVIVVSVVFVGDFVTFFTIAVVSADGVVNELAVAEILVVSCAVATDSVNISLVFVVPVDVELLVACILGSGVRFGSDVLAGGLVVFTSSNAIALDDGVDGLAAAKTASVTGIVTIGPIVFASFAFVIGDGELELVMVAVVPVVSSVVVVVAN